MEEYYWDGKIEYLRKSTALFYNDDYIHFLVRTVWNFDKPVHVIDFGCGFGHLGLRLLPMLPEGSTYTGIDAGEKLIQHAQALFRQSPYETRFICGDFLELPSERKYDLAVCHAVLLHMNDPITLLQRMKDCVVDGGMVACFEPHWNANMAGYYFEGMDLSSVIPLGILQKLYETGANRTGKDGNIGMKIPVYLSCLGLQNIQCRISDKVNVHIPRADPGLADADALFSVQFDSPGDREPYVRQLIERGLTAEEAETLYEAELHLHQQVNESIPVAYAPGMKISFGTIARECE